MLLFLWFVKPNVNYHHVKYLVEQGSFDGSDYTRGDLKLKWIRELIESAAKVSHGCLFLQFIIIFICGCTDGPEYWEKD